MPMSPIDFANGTRGMLDLCMFSEGAYWQEKICVTGDTARIEAKVPGPSRFSPDGKERDAEVVVSERATKKVSVDVVHVPNEVLEAGDHHGSTYFQHQRFRDLVLAGKGHAGGHSEGRALVRHRRRGRRKSARTGQAIEVSL